MKGSLYIVATPIGNLEDITLRALKMLREVDSIAAEDTRHSKKLLNHYKISKPIISYWSEKEKGRARAVIDSLKKGHSVALITDAGTPGISDPGEVLIRSAINEDINVIPVPGPSAIITALSVSGLSTKIFLFAGFLSSRASQRRKELQELRSEERTIVFYEAPHRLRVFLEDLKDIFGDRNIALCHELTKIHEDILRGKVSDVFDELGKRKVAGEYAIVVEGAEKWIYPLEEALDEIAELMKKGKSRRDAVREVANTSGLSKQILYREGLRRC